MLPLASAMLGRAVGLQNVAAAEGAAVLADLIALTLLAVFPADVPDVSAAAAVEALWKAGWHADGVDALVTGAALARLGARCTGVTLTAGLVGRAMDHEGRLLWLPLREWSATGRRAC